MATVRLHPESTGDPLTLRWVTDTTPLAEPTPSMSELVDDGTLAELAIGAGEIRTRLAAGRSWFQDGDRVRTVLFQALSTAYDHHGEDALRRQVDDILQRDVAPYVDSHGGHIAIESLTDDGTLTVSLSGTCGHCTMQTTTLRNVVAGAVQSQFPEIRSVRAVRG